MADLGPRYIASEITKKDVLDHGAEGGDYPIPRPPHMMISTGVSIKNSSDRWWFSSHVWLPDNATQRYPATWIIPAYSHHLAEVGSGGQTGFMASMSICSRGCRGWGGGSCPNVLLARFAEGEFPRKKTERPNRSLVFPYWPTALPKMWWSWGSPPFSAGRFPRQRPSSFAESGHLRARYLRGGWEQVRWWIDCIKQHCADLHMYFMCCLSCCLITHFAVASLS